MHRQNCRNLFLLIIIFLSFHEPGVYGQAPVMNRPFPLRGMLPGNLQKKGAETKVNFAKLLPSSFPDHKLSSQNATCKTSTFYMHLTPGPAEKIEVKEIQTTPDRNFIVAGNITLSNGVQHGFLYIIDNGGNVVLQKIFEIDNAPNTIYGLKIHPDGSLVIAGIVHEGTDIVFAACLHADLSTQWIHKYNTSSAPQKVTMDLADDIYITLGAQLPGLIWCAYLNSSDGSSIWQKEAPVAGLTELIGTNRISFDSVAIVANYLTAGKQGTTMIVLNGQNGNLSSSADLYSNESRFFKTRSYNDRLMCTGIFKMPSGQYVLARDISSGAQLAETQHLFQVPLNIDFNTASSLSNSGNVMGFTVPSQGKLIFLRQFAYYQTTPEYTRTYNVPMGSNIAATAESLEDGGYIFGLNTTASNEVILIKTDSIGTLAGCGFNDINNQFTGNIQAPNTPTTSTLNSVAQLVSGATLTNGAVSLTSQFDCNQLYCPAPPVEDTCLSSFYKTFRSKDYINGFGFSYLMQNDNILICTARYTDVLNNMTTASGGMELYDSKGNFMRGVTIFHDSISSAAGSMQYDKQHVVLVDYANPNGIPTYTLTMVDDNLQILWSKTANFGTNSLSASLTYPQVIRDDDGNLYIISCDYGFMQKSNVFVYKMDANGNGIWFKKYPIDQGNFFICSGVCTKTSLIIVNEGGPGGSVSVRIDKNNGEMLSAYIYQNACDGLIYYRHLGLAGDHIFYAGNNQQGNPVLGTFDTLGKPIQFKMFPAVYAVPYATSKDDMMYVKYNDYNNIGHEDNLMKMDTALKVQFDHAYGIIRSGSIGGIAVSDDGSIYVAGNFYYGGVNSTYADGYLEKYDANGVLGTCDYLNVIPSMSTIDLNVQPVGFAEIDENFYPDDIPDILVPESDGNVVDAILCSSPQTCNSVKVTGIAAICQPSQPYSYKAITNPGCTLKPLWIYDTSFVTITSYTDTTINLTFKKTGTTWIKVKLNAGCNIYTDSMQIAISNSNGILDLGPDTTICPGNIILLNAGPGYLSYQWQDGSTDSTFEVTKPGIYYVTVNDACGNVSSDTINVAPHLPIPFNIGADTSICQHDTVSITAPPGFIHYQWSTYNIMPDTGNLVKVFPDTTFMYRVTAEQTAGCFVSDSILIFVKQVPPVNLGNDTSFCTNDSIVLDAGNNYDSYLWNTNAVTETIRVNQQGVYSVKAKLNGCAAFDTMQVVNLYPLSVFSLGNDTTICGVGQLQYNFVLPQASYLWNTGSTSANFVIDNAGLYWLQVTSQTGCVKSDSIRVTYEPLPVISLGSDTTLCTGNNLILNAFYPGSGYTWQDGSISPQFTVTTSGLYHVAVDLNGCIVNDSIAITYLNKPYFNLGNDTLLCEGTTITLQPQLNTGASYTWQDGSNATTYIVKATGTYELTATNECGTFSDAIIITPGLCYLEMPNIFTPNGDGVNDAFRVKFPFAVTSFLFTVYNRFGQKVFETNDIKKGWDGNCQSLPQPIGSYVWLIELTVAGKPAQNYKGVVTLIR